MDATPASKTAGGADTGDTATTASLQAAQQINAFALYLRRCGYDISAAAVLDVQRLAVQGWLEHRQWYLHAMRSCFCQDPQQWQRFQQLFDHYWRAADSPSDGADVTSDSEASTGADASASVSTMRLVGFAGTSSVNEAQYALTGAGDYKALSLADFRFVFDAHTMREIEALVDALARRMRRRFRRREKTANTGHRVDARRTLAHAVSLGGVPLQLAYRKRQPRQQRFVLLIDISQSMEVYTKLFARFARYLLTVFEHSEAFAFNTELIPLASGSRTLAEVDIENRLNQLPKGWLGGTRIATSIRTFNEHYAPACVDRQTVVLIFSDGCDTDKPEALQEPVRQLRQRARRVIWVNPLLGRFEPGEADPRMDPLKPFLSHYCSAHNLQSLKMLGRVLLR